MKKYIKSIVVLAIGLLLFSCGEEYLDNPETDFTSGFLFSPSSSVLISETGNVKLNDFVPLGDLSVGVLSRKWEITNGNFLKSNIKPGDSLNLNSYIDNSKGTTTNDKVISVLFNKAGLQTITYTGVFEKETIVDLGSSRITTVKNDNDEWVATQEYKFDVYADPVVNYTITKEGIDITADKTVTLEAGESLVFTDLNTIESVGRPDSRRWEFNTGSPATSRNESVEVFFTSLGTFNVGKITTSRSTPLETNIIENIDLVVEVIASTKPYVYIDKSLNAITETNQITFNVSGEIASIPELEKDNFKVFVTNTDFGWVDETEIAIKNLKLDPSDKTKVVLEVDPIYNSDETISVVYNASVTDVTLDGGIRSVDDRLLLSFEKVEAKLDLGASVLDPVFAGVEAESTVGSANRWKAAYAFGYWVGPKNGSSTELAYNRTEEIKPQGSVASMSYTHRDGLDANLTLQGSNFNLGGSEYPAGTYRVSYDVLRSENIVKFINVGIASIEWDLSTVPANEWGTVSKKITITEPIPSHKNSKLNTKILTTDNPSMVAGDQFYFTNLKWILLNERE